MRHVPSRYSFSKRTSTSGSRPSVKEVNPADVGEQKGGLPSLAPQTQRLGLVHELLHHRRSQVVAERRADPPSLRLGADEIDERPPM